MKAAVGRSVRLAACLAAAVLLTDAGGARAATVAALDASDPMPWLVKSVCTNAQNQPVVADPYGGCPAGDGIRKIQAGDPLPYHNIEQEGYQQRDSFPLVDPITNSSWILADYDYSPFDLFNLYNGTDGYDVYVIQNGWVSAVGTSDGGGYGQTFWGANCALGGGWVLFPASGFLTAGHATVPIADVYWEQKGQSYPGACPTQLSTNTQTAWSYQTGFKFGGVNGNPVKTMSTVISNHGFQSGSGFLKNGHIEVFYFTREYGITRWEVWTPIQQNPTQTKECVVPRYEKYQGVTFVAQYCHDWSVYTPATSSTPALPVWPIPNISLLKQAHFDGVITSTWTPAGASTDGHPLSWSVANANSPRDVAVTGPGPRYLKLTCTAGSGAACGGITGAGAEAMVQDIPAGQFPASGTYGFGVNARSEPVNGASTSGTIGVGVEQLDAAGNVLWADSTAATVASDNGTSGQESQEEAQSVYLSSAFVCETTTITLDPNAATIRFLIAPQTPQLTFDVLDAWLAPYPAPTAPWAAGVDPCNPGAATMAATMAAAAQPVDTPWYLVIPRLHAPLGLSNPPGRP